MVKIIGKCLTLAVLVAMLLSVTSIMVETNPASADIDGVVAAGNDNPTSAYFIVDTAGPVITTTPSSPIYTNENWIELLISMRDVVPMTNGNLSIYSNGVFMEGYPINGMDGALSSGYYAMLYPENGVNNYHITVNDSAGNSNTIVVTVYRDVTAPTVQIITPVNHSYNNTGAATLTWAAQTSIGIDRYEIFVNGGLVATVGAGTTSYALTLGEGNDEIDVYVYDLAGNSAHATVKMIVDLTGPLVEIVSPVAGERVGTSMTVSWQGANPLSGIAYYVVAIDGAVGTKVSATTLSQVFTGLAFGSHNVSVKAVDNSGNSANDSVAFIVDDVRPTISWRTPTGDNVSRNATIVVAFSETMNQTSTTIVVGGVNGTLAWSGIIATFTPSSLLAYGTTYSVTVNGKDIAGNSMTPIGLQFTTLNGYGNITGMIKDASGNILANTTVALSNGLTTTTDADGAFSFENVTVGSYTLTVSKSGYQTYTQNVSMTAGETTALGLLSVQTSPSGPPGSNDALMFGIVAIVIIALLAILLLVVKRRKKKE